VKDKQVVDICGRLTKDPMPFKDGTVVRFTIASSTYFPKKDDDGFNKETAFFDCVCFGRIAAAMMATAKGSEVRVNGRFRTESYTDKEGENKTKLSLVATWADVLKPIESELNKPNRYQPKRNDHGYQEFGGPPDNDQPF
jgi:single stranded DNA-binding protein